MVHIIWEGQKNYKIAQIGFDRIEFPLIGKFGFFKLYNWGHTIARVRHSGASLHNRNRVNHVKSCDI